MAKFEEAIPIILKHEGRFVNHPLDPGGATNRGITFKLFKKWAELLGLPATVDGLKQLTEEQAKRIYKADFWDEMRGDDFQDQQVANIVFDGFVNMGYRAIKIFQRSVGAEPDGKIGPKTLYLVHIALPEIVFENYKERRSEYYNDRVKRRPDQGVFLKGWLNRINSFKYKKDEGNI